MFQVFFQPSGSIRFCGIPVPLGYLPGRLLVWWFLRIYEYRYQSLAQLRRPRGCMRGRYPLTISPTEHRSCPFGGAYLTLHRNDSVHDRWKLCLTGIIHCAPHLPIFFITMIIQPLNNHRRIPLSAADGSPIFPKLPSYRSCLDSESKRTSVTLRPLSPKMWIPTPVMTRPTQTHFGSAEEANNLRLRLRDPSGMSKPTACLILFAFAGVCTQRQACGSLSGVEVGHRSLDSFKTWADGRSGQTNLVTQPEKCLPLTIPTRLPRRWQNMVAYQKSCVPLPLF